MPSQAWIDQQIILVKIAARFEPRITRHLIGEYTRALAVVKSKGLQYAIDNILDWGIDTEMLEILMDIYDQSGVRLARVAYRDTLRRYPLKAMLKKATGQMGISEKWLQAVREALAAHAIGFVTDITRTTRLQLLAIFEKAVKEGWSYEDIAREMLESGLARRRARVIARTEVHRGGMKGSLEGAKSLPYVAEKKWLSGSDNRVRRNPRDVFDHRELNNQTVDLDQPFRNEELIMYPGDPDASAGNTIQCRCVMSYVPKLVNGKPIIK